MENNNDRLTLLLVLLLAQNKELLREIDPVLTFWEQHKDSFSLFSELFRSGQGLGKEEPTMSATNPPRSAEEAAKKEPPQEATAKKSPSGAQEKQSPLQEIAGEEIWKELNAYFSASSKEETLRNMPSA